MNNIILILSIFVSLNHCQTIKQLPELSILEELPIGSTVTSLTDKIPNLDQSIEYDLVSPLSSDLDLFSIDHQNHLLKVKHRIDYEYLCTKKAHCTISVSIARSNDDTIDVYILPIRIKNVNDNPIRFTVNRTVIEIDENDEHWQEKTYALPRAIDDDGDEITYSLYLQNWNKPDGLFHFNERNLTLQPLKKFDREEQNIYVLRLIAHNHNDVSTDIIILIRDLNDNRPTCEQNLSVFVISNLSNVSTFHLNATDLDEGDNGKLEYRFIENYSGFTIDHHNGQIKFHFKQWTHRNHSILTVNITDHGRPVRLSTQCFIQIQIHSLYHIDFQSKIASKNQSEFVMKIDDPRSNFGRLNIIDRQNNQTCIDCFIRLNFSIENLLNFNPNTLEFSLNFDSLILKRILTNYAIINEHFLLTIHLEIQNQYNPMIISKETFHFKLYFNKLQFLTHSNIYFLRINENLQINEKISIANTYHSCLTNPSKTSFNLIDSTNTFDYDNKLNLIVKKTLNRKQIDHYHLNLKEKQTNNSTVSCSIEFFVYIFDPYSLDAVYPYFQRAFYVLSSSDLSKFSLPSLPPHVKYISSVPDLITLNPNNASIIIRSSSLYSSYYYDFSIEARDFRIPSLSSSIPIRIFFGRNQYLPRLLVNSTQEIREIDSSNYLFQIQAFDPDILLNNQMNLNPPAIEYEIVDSEQIEIEKYTGRIFLKDVNLSKVNFTLIIKDFGQPKRLILQENFLFYLKQKSRFIPFSFLVLCSFILIILILLSILVLLIHCCCCRQTRSKSLEKPTWKNISPTTPDTRLIDHEYMTSTTLPRISPVYSYEFTSDYQKRLSINDVNRYLERFEKIYNDSSSFHQPMGSVV